MVFSMQASTALVPRKLRRCFLESPRARWLVPLWRCMHLPLAVNRKRFLVPLCVLTLVDMVFLFGQDEVGFGFANSFRVKWLSRCADPPSSGFFLLLGLHGRRLVPALTEKHGQAAEFDNASNRERYLIRGISGSGFLVGP